ncbi:DUF3137 domain-containing protein [Campylobacter corcagiensis]|uniref:DUF3137 domain-containing protein n=1 Tax=Campylobacter corcagiensis TaxID=1448857 RepID=A0A7M1LK34_9BACT|nr:DUF3137 domain-containing protein [Campylobacter corcagiensis]QKF65533.1 DUF3137 domain-containing membrane protein [Campylobacter corcagiensis]QOQ87895.1 DUF3137 domain-containing protein [Campylobacter corcagiensis]
MKFKQNSITKNLERKRKELLKKLIIATVGFGLVFIFGFVMFIKGGEFKFIPFIFLVFIYVFVLYGLKFRVTSSFIGELNKALFDKGGFKNISYERRTKVENLAPNLGKVIANDKFSGEYRGVNFSFCDVRVEFGEIDFKGKVFEASFKKPFKNEIFITNLGLLRAENLTKFEIDNSYINENFILYAKDLQEAMYILTPSLIEKFEALCKGVNDKNLRADILFKNSKLIIVLETKTDFLEPNIFKSINNLNSNELKFEIDKFLKLIEYLNLHTY